MVVRNKGKNKISVERVFTHAEKAQLNSRGRTGSFGRVVRRRDKTTRSGGRSSDFYSSGKKREL